jgi:hypothetical protein
VVRSLAIADPRAFDLDLNDTLVPPPLEVQPSEPMLACTPPPTEQMDTTAAAIPSASVLEPKDTIVPAGWSMGSGEQMLACLPPRAAPSDPTEVEDRDH